MATYDARKMTDRRISPPKTWLRYQVSSMNNGQATSIISIEKSADGELPSAAHQRD